MFSWKNITVAIVVVFSLFAGGAGGGGLEPQDADFDQIEGELKSSAERNSGGLGTPIPNPIQIDSAWGDPPCCSDCTEAELCGAFVGADQSQRYIASCLSWCRP